MTSEIEERIKLLLADGWTQMGDLFYKDDLIIGMEVVQAFSSGENYARL